MKRSAAPPSPIQRALAAFTFLAAAAVAWGALAQELKQSLKQDLKAVEAESDPTAPRYGEAISTRYRVGAKVSAKGGVVQNIYIMVAVPLECAEQEVHVVQEDYSPQVGNVDFRTLPDEKRAEPGARQMLITIPELAAGQDAQALITYEVVTKAVLPPAETASLKAPAKPDRSIKPYLTASPFINVNHRKIRDAVRDALAAKEKGNGEKAGDQQADKANTEAGAASTFASPGDEPAKTEATQGGAKKPEVKKDEAVEPAALSDAGKTATPDKAEFKTGDAAFISGDEESPTPNDGKLNDWQRTEAIYDYVQDHIEYEAGAPDKAALQTLEDGKADCHGLAALFVAMCRTAKIPARMVWVDGHQYAEFYLESAPGKGHWYPVQSAGTRAFGEMPLPKVILQKGDKFVVPERRREQLRYASDYTVLKAAAGNKPTVKYVREQL